MRRILSIICALFVAALLPAAWMVSHGLPADTGSYVAQKYDGWNGVLQAWVCCEWKAGGSFITWLNRCAAEFEKAHEGVYIEFTPVSAQTLQDMWDSGLRVPEIIFFSPGTLGTHDGLRKLNTPDALRDDLRISDTALPVAMGGYIWVYNRALCGGAPDREQALPLTMLPDGHGRCFSAALIGLLSGERLVEETVPDMGIDLGLPANADMREAALAISEDALDEFIDGSLPCLPVTQAELARLARLQESGRGPDWACGISGDFAWADQLLLLGLTEQEGTDFGERMALAEEFAHGLFEDDSQAALADTGVFSVTGRTIHTDFSAHAELDVLLNSRTLIVPEIFSEYSCANAAEIVREYCRGECSYAAALAKMGLKFSLPNHPN